MHDLGIPGWHKSHYSKYTKLHIYVTSRWDFVYLIYITALIKNINEPFINIEMLKIQYVRHRIIMPATSVFVCVSLTICCLFMARYSKGKIKVKSTWGSGGRAPLTPNLSATWIDWSTSRPRRFTVEKSPFFHGI